MDIVDDPRLRLATESTTEAVDSALRDIRPRLDWPIDILVLGQVICDSIAAGDSNEETRAAAREQLRQRVAPEGADDPQPDDATADKLIGVFAVDYCSEILR